MSLVDKIVTMAETIGADVRELISGKVDKVSGKGLSDTNFTQAEKSKLAGIVSVTTKNVGIPAHNIDPIDAIDLGVSVPGLVSPNENAGVYVGDTKSALFSGNNNIEVHEDYVQIAVSSDEEGSMFALEPDDAIFILMRGEEYEQYSLKEMFRNLDAKFNSSDVAQEVGDSSTKVMSQKASAETFYRAGSGVAKAGKIHVQSTAPTVDVEDGDIWLKI